MNHENHVEPLESPREYAKFVLVIAGIVLASILITSWRGWSLEQFMSDFMGVFLLTFAAFKFMNLEMFAITYRGYDVVAKRWPRWGYVFPFVEAGLGLSYLLGGEGTTLNVLTMLITSLGAIGVIKELRRKSAVMCACLGTVIRLPLSRISFVEDFAMFLMAAVMLWLA